MNATRIRHPGRHRFAILLLGACCGLLGACGDASREATSAVASAASTPESALAAAPVAASLRMTIDGVEWTAEHDLFGAVHPLGYDRSILIAGSRGGKNPQEQAFNLNLFGIDAPGRYRVTSKDPKTGAAQIANLSAERYLAGNVFGYDLEVEIVRFSKNPDRIEARFSGTLNANDGAKVELRDGRFLYDGASAN